MNPKISTLHHKLRHFSDHIVDEEMRIYHEAGVDIPYRWHSILQILQEKSHGLTISELADLQEKTHPDVVYTINQMVKDGMVAENEHITDKRKRLISPTDKAQKLIAELKPLWSAVQDAANNWIREIAPDLLLNIEALNQSLEEKSFYNRIRQEKKKTDIRRLVMKPFADIKDNQQLILSYWNQFKSKYFYVPEIESSLHQLTQAIKKHEANAYFLSTEDHSVGSSILYRRSFHIAEIIFLHIDENHRRKYFATSLMHHMLHVAKDIGVRQLFIQSHARLFGLNSLLKKNDFILSDQMIGSSIKYKELPLVYLREI